MLSIRKLAKMIAPVILVRGIAIEMNALKNYFKVQSVIERFFQKSKLRYELKSGFEIALCISEEHNFQSFSLNICNGLIIT